jgi:hypothetical protein
VLADRGRTQFRTAETEKYPHVTYFFNGGNEVPYRGEERSLVASQKVATYDLAPEMSAAGITDVLCRAIEAREHDFILCNYANADKDHVWELNLFLNKVDGSLPTVIAGDFNESPKGDAVRVLEQRGFRNALPLFHPGQPTWQGRSVADPDKWARGQITVNTVYPIGVAIVQLCELFGIPVAVTAEQAAAIAFGALTLFNVVAVSAGSERVGLPHRDSPDRAAGNVVAEPRRDAAPVDPGGA